MAKPLSELLIVGGNVAIDFVNTVGGMRDAPPDPDDDVLTGYEELVAWSVLIGLISHREAEALRRAARREGSVLQRPSARRSATPRSYRPTARCAGPGGRRPRCRCGA